MSYKISAKNRKLKRTLVSFFQFIKFKWLHIDVQKKIIIAWVMMNFFSLFLHWIDTVNNSIQWNVFQSSLWIVWYFILLLNIKIVFSLFDNKIKDTLKSFFHFDVKDSIHIIYFWFFWLFLSINSIFSIQDLQRFQEGIIVGRWPIVATVWFIFIIIWWFLVLHTKTKTWIYIDTTEKKNEEIHIQENENEKKNMKLPF